jgi:hypothetical protein
MNFDEISEKLKKMSDEQVLSELETVIVNSDYDPIKVGIKALEFCYRHEMCGLFGIRYGEITRKDFDRARLASYLWIKKK